MAINLDKLRAFVKEKTAEQPALTEQDLEAEKTRLQEEIRLGEETGATEPKTSDGLVSLEYIAHQNNINRLAELEENSLAALDENQREERMLNELDGMHKRGELKLWQEDSE